MHLIDERIPWKKIWGSPRYLTVFKRANSKSFDAFLIAGTVLWHVREWCKRIQWFGIFLFFFVRRLIPFRHFPVFRWFFSPLRFDSHLEKGWGGIIFRMEMWKKWLHFRPRAEFFSLFFSFEKLTTRLFPIWCRVNFQARGNSNSNFPVKMKGK